MSDVTTIRSKSGCTFPVTKIGDRNYFMLPKVPDFRQRLADMRALEVRPDDIFVGGMPKCGNNWSYELVSMVTRQEKHISSETGHSHQVEFLPSSNIAETARSWPSPRILCYHTRLTSELPAQIVEAKPKIIYVMRNPKDMIVSGFHFYKSLRPVQFTGTWEDYLEMHLTEEFPPDSWYNHVLDAEKFIKENPEVPFHLLVYEKMKEDLEGEVKKLCQFLGKPTDMAKEIAAAGEFQKFKPAMEKIKFDEIEKRIFSSDNVEAKFFRKGIIGDWKSAFTASQSDAVDQLFKTKMAESKLARIVEPYM